MRISTIRANNETGYSKVSKTIGNFRVRPSSAATTTIEKPINRHQRIEKRQTDKSIRKTEQKNSPSTPVNNTIYSVSHSKASCLGGRPNSRQQDVTPDDVRPLIDIAYWTSFPEVKRDTAAALKLLAQNTANLQVLSEVGALGALLSVLSSSKNRSDLAIARESADALSALVKLHSVKLKLLQAPDGIECIFSILETTDFRLRRTGFDIILNLVSVEELRVAIAKREGFAYMMSCCTSKDPQIRCMAIAILNQLAESRPNRILFNNTRHFISLSAIIRDPFMEKESMFQCEWFHFIDLILLERENGKTFVGLNLLPLLLSNLRDPFDNLHVCMYILSIIEKLAQDQQNHRAIVTASTLVAIVSLCHQIDEPNDSNKPAVSKRLESNRRLIVRNSLVSNESDNNKKKEKVIGLLENMTQFTILRLVFSIFCEMAKCSTNRRSIIQSHLVEYIAQKKLYASPDKRVRRSVITLLTFLISKEQEHQRVDIEQREEPVQKQDSDFKHYIELLARGVIQCLFGILQGNDFTMKLESITAITHLTEDQNSRITLCAEPLISAIRDFAFHPVPQTRKNVAKIIANLAERQENVLRLVDEGILSILVKYINPATRDKAILLHSTRAVSFISETHVARAKLVECGILSALIQQCKTSNMDKEVREHVLQAIRNLRLDAAALRIQTIFRGWNVRLQNARANIRRKRRLKKLNLTGR